MQYIALRSLRGLTHVKNDNLSATPLTQSLSREAYFLDKGKDDHWGAPSTHRNG